MRYKICILYLSVLMAATVQIPSFSAEELKGTVTMVKGNDITLQLDDQGFVNKGDKVEIYMDAGGVPIPYGTWRVSAVKDDGTIEAEPDEIGDTPPTPRLKATIYATGTKPLSEAEELCGQALKYYFEAGDHPGKGHRNSKGWDIYEKNLKKAIELYRRSFEKGHGEAAFRLAHIYWLGLYWSNPNGITKEEKEEDNTLGFQWFLKAAENGHWEAALMVGRFYYSAKGTDYDIDKVEHWYRKADELAPPDREILNEFGFILESLGMEDKAIAVYRESARKGQKKAQERLKEKGLAW